MSSKQEDENYWNHSDFKPFSFDDDELGNKNRVFGNKVSSSILADIIFDGVPKIEQPEKQKRPIETLISQNSLNKIFQDEFSSSPTFVSPEEELKILRRQVSNQWVPQAVSKTIKQIVLGQPYTLHLYQSLSLKKELLDEAIKSGDGNAILMVVIFLSKTLKKNLFYQILQTRPTAVSQYMQYLSTRMMISELIDLLEMSGQSRDAAMKQYTFIVQGTQNKETKLNRISTCYNNHFSPLALRDKDLVQDHIQYLQWMLSMDPGLAKSMPTNSVLSSLSYLCKNHWSEPKSSKKSPWFLSSQQNITDRQVQWVILKSRSSVKSWEDIEAHFLTKGWLNGMKLKGIIPVEKIIMELHQQNAPYNVLSQYLEVINNLEKRLELVKQLPCHKAVIDVYVLMKDRRGIQEYKVNLKPQSEEYIHAESALKFQIKWKN